MIGRRGVAVFIRIELFLFIETNIKHVLVPEITALKHNWRLLAASFSVFIVWVVWLAGIGLHLEVLPEGHVGPFEVLALVLVGRLVRVHVREPLLGVLVRDRF